MQLCHSALRDEFNDIPWPTRFAHNSFDGAYGGVDNGTDRHNHMSAVLSKLFYGLYFMPRPISAFYTVSSIVVMIIHLNDTKLAVETDR